MFLQLKQQYHFLVQDFFLLAVLIVFVSLATPYLFNNSFFFLAKYPIIGTST